MAAASREKVERLEREVRLAGWALRSIDSCIVRVGSVSKLNAEVVRAGEKAKPRMPTNAYRNTGKHLRQAAKALRSAKALLARKVAARRNALIWAKQSRRA